MGKFKEGLKKFVTKGGLYKLIQTGCNVVKDINEGVLGKDGILEKMGVVQNDGDIRGVYNDDPVPLSVNNTMANYVKTVAEKCSMALDKSDENDQSAISMLEKIYTGFNKMITVSNKNEIGVVEKKDELRLQIGPNEKVIKISSPSRLYNSLVENLNTGVATNLGQIQSFQYLNGADNSGISIKDVIIPNTIDQLKDSKNYQVIDDTLINLSEPEAGSILSTQEKIFKMGSVHTSLKLKLKVLHDLNEEQFQEFAKEISIIWKLKNNKQQIGDEPGDDEDDSVFVTQVENNTDDVQPNEIIEKRSLILSQDDNGNLVTNYEEGKTDQFCANYRAFLIQNDSDKPQTVKCISDDYGLQSKLNSIGRAKSEYDRGSKKKCYFSFVTEKELIDLAKVYKSDRKNLKMKVLQCAYRHRHCRNYLPVFKNGVLDRFIERKEIDSLKDDEEYEENEVHFVF